MLYGESTVLLYFAILNFRSESCSELTGKIDVFAFGLVVMYMYKGVHMLVRVITEGKENYNSYSPMERQLLQNRLMLHVCGSRITGYSCDICDIFINRNLLKHLKFLCAFAVCTFDRLFA